ncbi:plasmid mobilization protein [Clostridium saccharoperbutylacetonicum]|uniref:plasmid mobilization protein n=1 Tax=Clostridium saccharoperbutylacetonicum TaxID=36745 RepID=UPI0039ECDE28
MKDATIMLRVTTEQKQAIKRMARQQGMTITEFILFNMMKSISEVELSKLNGKIPLDSNPNE